MTALVHIAGPDIQVNHHLRQRCAWCGTVLLDYNLALIAVPTGQDPRPSTWPAGALIQVDGQWSSVVEHTADQPLPDEACALIDPEVTR